MHRRPASITVVFDPQNPAAHRAVGAMEPSRVDGRRLMILGAAAVAFGFMVVVSAIEWFDQRRSFGTRTVAAHGVPFHVCARIRDRLHLAARE